MEHARTLAFKSIANGIPAILILTLFGGVDLIAAILLALALTAIAYLLGDMLILPAAGNIVAATADAGLAILFLWFIRSLGVFIEPAAIMWTGIALGLVEGLFFHPYIAPLVGVDNRGPRTGNR